MILVAKHLKNIYIYIYASIYRLPRLIKPEPMAYAMFPPPIKPIRSVDWRVMSRWKELTDFSLIILCYFPFKYYILKIWNYSVKN